MKKVIFKIPAHLLTDIRTDLTRPHPFAAERVGFIACSVAALESQGLLVLARDFHPVDDADYLDDPSVGAMMGREAIREALQIAYKASVSMFHVHLHEHRGRPWFSRTDLREAANFVPDFWHVQPKIPHGAVVLSLDSLAGLCWIPGSFHKGPIRIWESVSVGAPMQIVAGE